MDEFIFRIFEEYIGDTPINNPNYNFRANLSNDIVHELNDSECCSWFRIGQVGVSTRNRKLTVKNLIVMILGFKTSIQREADRFFKELNDEDFNIRTVSKGAFTKARSKLKPEAFKHLNDVACRSFYTKARYHLWHQKRLMAVDGTRLMLPNHPIIEEEFGVHTFGPNADSVRSMAMGSILYDPLNQIALDSQIAPYNASERDLLLLHLDKLKSGDILLLDRGYPCFWLLFLLAAQKIDFCVRLKEDWWLKVKEFREGNLSDTLVEFKLPKKDFSKLDKYPEIREKPLKCRLLKIALENGETEILCTSLSDSKQYKEEEFKALYHCRWAEEECFKLLKSRIEVERFSGKTALAVKQDFHAKVFMLTLMAAYAHPIEEKVKKEFATDDNRKYSQKINRTNALSMTYTILIDVMLKEIVHKALAAFDDIVFRTRELIRPNRKNKRKHRQKKPYSQNYKLL